MPLIIRNGISTAKSLIIEEDVLETLLILFLFGLSFLLLRGLLDTLQAYRHAADCAAHENTTLMARLAEAFKYIGTVNVEIQEIESVLCGIDCYPRSRKEFRRCYDHLAAKAMAITGSPWVVIRVIDRPRCRTLKECRVERRKGILPTVTIGNRDILERRRVDGSAVVALTPKNLDLLAACILPDRPRSGPEQLLLTAILNQVVMLFLLQRAGCFQPTTRQLPAQ
jgi:hypothetical protein